MVAIPTYWSTDVFFIFASTIATITTLYLAIFTASIVINQVPIITFFHTIFSISISAFNNLAIIIGIAKETWFYLTIMWTSIAVPDIWILTLFFISIFPITTNVPTNGINTIITLNYLTFLATRGIHIALLNIIFNFLLITAFWKGDILIIRYFCYSSTF